MENLLRNLKPYSGPPKPIAQSFNREFLIARQKKAIKEATKEKCKNPFVMGTMSTEFAPNYFLHPVELTRANKISIEDIRRKGMNSMLEGKFLLCRPICPPCIRPPLNLVVEDPDGNTVHVSISSDYCEEGQVKIGEPIAIMHPWFKLDSDGIGTICSDNPDHYERLPANHAILKGISWKGTFLSESNKPEPEDPGAEGTRHYRNGDFNEALKCYTQSIKKNPTSSVMLSNRAAAFLALDKPQLALLDADNGLALDPTNAKLIHCKATSLLKLNKCQETISFLEHLPVKHADLDQLLLRAKLQLQESNNSIGCAKCRTLIEDPSVSKVTRCESNDPGADGSRHFRTGNYKEALNCYTEAFKRDPSNPVMFSNRSATYLALNKPQLALADAEMGLSIDPVHVKLMFRKAKALLKLNKYQAAVAFLENGSIENSELKDLLEHAKMLLEESKHGKYDLIKMAEDGKRSYFLDHADYFNPAVRVLPVAGKGRGLVAMKALSAGTLICACKAFAYLPRGSKLDAGDGILKQSYHALTAVVCDKLKVDPSQAEKVFNMYGGQEVGVSCENCGSISLATSNVWDQVYEVVQLSLFLAHPDFVDGPGQTDLEGSLEELFANSGIGLWIFPSFINHCCMGQNCYQTFIGDFMFIRAIKDIKADEELEMEYLGDDMLEDLTVVEKLYKFKCKCRLCKVMEGESARAKAILASSYVSLDILQGNYTPAAINGAKSALSAVKAARPDLSLNFIHYMIMERLAATYMALENRKEAIACLENCVDSLLKMTRVKLVLKTVRALCSYLSFCSNRTEMEKKIGEKWEDELKRLGQMYLGDCQLLGNFLPPMSFIPNYFCC